jgi:hypothetical protein
MGSVAAQYKAAGFTVVMSSGIHYPPSWVPALPDGQYVDQFGVGSGTPNFVWSSEVRSAAEAYIAAIVKAVPDADFWRVGLSPSGECYLPNTSTNQWWAFNAAAQGTCPVPGWVPGNLTISSAQVQQWWDWYLQSIIDAHIWEINTYRSAGYKGWVMPVVPGYGAGPSVIAQRLATSLGPPYDSTLNIGAAWHLLVPALAKRGDMALDISSVYDGSGSPANNSGMPDLSVPLSQADPYVSGWSATRWLAYLAAKSGVKYLGENVGGQGYASNVAGVMAQAHGCGLGALLWANGPSLTQPGYASPAEVVAGWRRAANAEAVLGPEPGQ